ncbi:MAG: hypothetical protein WCU74_09505, partial [Candidatus Omnitrophota bacterium]
MAPSPFRILSDLKLPEDLGSVEEMFLPEGSANADKAILLIQSAHANIDAETNTRLLVDYFSEKYQLSLVLLEGGAGDLDSLLFRSFPDKELKGKILEEYLAAGDLTGGEISSILNDRFNVTYAGIETPKLYEQNKKAFLDATGRGDDLRRVLDRIEDSVRNLAAAKLSEDARAFVEKKKAFEQDNLQLLDYLKFLEGFDRELSAYP